MAIPDRASHKPIPWSRRQLLNFYSGNSFWCHSLAHLSKLHAQRPSVLVLHNLGTLLNSYFFRSHAICLVSKGIWTNSVQTSRRQTCHSWSHPLQARNVAVQQFRRMAFPVGAHFTTHNIYMLFLLSRKIQYWFFKYFNGIEFAKTVCGFGKESRKLRILPSTRAAANRILNK